MFRASLALVAIVCSAFALPAVAAGAPPKAPAGQTVQQLADRSEAWLEATLRVPIPTRKIEAGDQLRMDTCDGWAATIGAPYGCTGMAYPETIVLNAYAHQQLANLAARPWVIPDTDAVRLLIHEQLHSDRDHTDADEYVVDALAHDLTRAWIRQVLRNRYTSAVSLGYANAVVVRKASAILAGAPWTGREARAIRRQLWAMSSADRAATIAGAFR